MVVVTANPTNWPIRSLWDLLLRDALSEDGVLHHE